MADKIIAVAAGHEITENEFNEFLTRISPQQQQVVQTPEGRQQALIQYANYFLFEKLGEEKEYDKTEDFLRILEGARRDLLSQYALTMAVKDITTSLEECREYYEKNPSQFVKDGETVPFEDVVQQIGQKLVQDKQNQVYMAERAKLIEKYGLEFR